ncbi:P-loop containing nucleoside triphosphate hydrolase protein [Boletus reticuloceps]|uniref:P-loop containing nucleoside triphosphate hydrolase protein n=1 Tax=Boletus reticuloceps TaxID=495285 RepID=A0A8I2YCR0_9AGAM|nr:P-loop containing nucleoside triphosphate hydrolase protein [Boletus reticuloceps]
MTRGMRHFNVVVLGAGGVGKSALTVRFVQDVFLETYDPTIEEAYRRILDVDGVKASLEVLDTAGAEQFTALNEFYIKSGQGFVLVFRYHLCLLFRFITYLSPSLTQEASLREVNNLRQQIYHIKGGDITIPIVVVGTKLDLVAEREVSRSTIQSLVARWGIPFYETSAKRNWHISDVFQGLVKQMLARHPDDPSCKKPTRFRKPCTVM